MRNLLPAILIIFTLFSCRPEGPATNHGQQIDSLQTELRKMNGKLNSLDIQRVQHIHDSLSRYYDTTAVTDTLESRHRKLQQARDVLNWYDNIDREITFSRSHLRAMERQASRKKKDTTIQNEIDKEKQIISGLKERFSGQYRELRQAVDQLLNDDPYE